MKSKILYIILILTVLAALTACSGDETGQQPVVNVDEQSYPLWPGSITRAGAMPSSPTDKGNIRLYLTRDKDATYFEGMFQYLGTDDSGNDQWRSATSVNAEAYHIYGFMPVDVAPVALGMRTGASDYKTGAVLTFSNLSPVLAQDFCVITGVEETDATPTQCLFSFEGSKTGSYLSLLLDHLYTKAVFLLRVGEAYSKLRTIRITQLSLQTEGAAGLTLTVNLPVQQPMTIDYGAAVVPSATSLPVANMCKAVAKLETTTDAEFSGYFAPLAAVYSKLYLVATYDVYDDKNTTLIRKDCTSRNKLSFDDPAKVVRGNYFIFNLKVEPTYLYQLSDADLDNPTIKIE